MTDWRIRQRYGFGAGQLRLSPHASNLVKSPATARAGLSQAGRELHDRSWSRSLRTAVTAIVALGIGAALLLSLAANYLANPADETDLQIVEFKIPEAPEPPMHEIAPAPRAPAPAEPVLAEASAPPEPSPIPAPEPVALAMPQMRPPAIPLAPVPERPQTRPEPRVKLQRPVVQIDAVARAAAPLPVAEPRASRSASERSLSRAQPAVRIDPVSRLSEPRPPQTRPSRSVATRPRHTAAVSRAPASLAPVEIAVASAPEERARKSGRLSNATRTAVRQERTPRNTVQPAALIGYGAVAASPARFEMASTSSRSGQRAIAENRSSKGERDAHLEGVPLSALAACVSDREEDALKLDLLELVSRPRECVSPAGRYRFVETKNLNAFLMWIERSAQRKQADRCIELRLALDCLQLQDGYGGST